jgi:hypothetical protein
MARFVRKSTLTLATIAAVFVIAFGNGAAQEQKLDAKVSIYTCGGPLQFLFSPHQEFCTAATWTTAPHFRRGIAHEISFLIDCELRGFLTPQWRENPPRFEKPLIKQQKTAPLAPFVTVEPI